MYEPEVTWKSGFSILATHTCGSKTLCRPKGGKMKFLELTNFVLLVGPLHPDSDSESFPPVPGKGQVSLSMLGTTREVLVFLENFGLPDR